MSCQRNSSIELLRLVLMLLIVIHHEIVHGLGLSGLSTGADVAIQPNRMLLFCLMNSFCIPAVNVFLLISGYFGVKFSLEKCFSLVFSALFYTLLFSTPVFILKGNIKHAFISLFVLSHGPYWFLVDYLFLMLFAPFLNHYFETSCRKTTSLFILGLIVISVYFGFAFDHRANNDGYTLLQFIMMYCIGRYLRTYNIGCNRMVSIAIYVVCSLICGAGMYVLHLSGRDYSAWKLSYYNNPLIICSAISIFLFFISFKFKSPIINKLAMSSLAIYLVQNAAIPERLLYDRIRLYNSTYNSAIVVTAMITLALVVGVISIGLDQIQIKLNKLCSRFLRQSLLERKNM